MLLYFGSSAALAEHRRRCRVALLRRCSLHCGQARQEPGLPPAARQALQDAELTTGLAADLLDRSGPLHGLALGTAAQACQRVLATTPDPATPWARLCQATLTLHPVPSPGTHCPGPPASRPGQIPLQLPIIPNFLRAIFSPSFLEVIDEPRRVGA